MRRTTPRLSIVPAAFRRQQPDGPPPPIGGLGDVDRVSTFEALGDPRYRLLWLGSLFSFLGVQIQIIARGWLAYSLTGSNKGLGAVYLGFGVPMLLLTLWGGVAADRLPKRRVLVGAQFLLVVSAGGIATAIATGAIRYWMLIVSAMIQGIGFSFIGPVRMAFTGELVGRRALPNAIVLQQMSMNATRIFGPSVAGVLIGVAAFGIGGVYWLTAGILVAAMLVTLRLPFGAPAKGRPERSPLGELRDGVSYVRHSPLLLLLVLTSMAVVMTAFPYIAFLPALAEEVFGVGPGGYGLMSGASAVGALIASLFIASRASGDRAWRLQVIAGLGFGLGVVGLSISPSFGIALVVIVLTGAATSAFQGLNNSLVLGNTDLAYHGRVQSLLMLAFSGFGMAALPLGALADAIGLRQTLGIMGLLAAGAVVVYAIVRRRVLRADPGAHARLTEVASGGSAPPEITGAE